MRKGISELIAVQSFLPVVGESSVWRTLEAFLAIEKLMDQALLADFTKNDKQADVRGATGGAPPQPNDIHAWLRRAAKNMDRMSRDKE